MAARWIMAAALLFGSVSVSSAQMRLMGLDRFYFDHMAGPGEQLPGLLLVIDSLPDNLRWPAVDMVQDEAGTIVQDFPIVASDPDRELWIREIRVTTKGGIDVLWWALYDGGFRSDLWTFAANRIRHDGKILSDYRLNAIVEAGSMVEASTQVDATQPRNLVLQVAGELDSAEGWRRGGYEWTLTERGDSLVVTGARTVFDLYRPAGEKSVIEAIGETSSEDRIQIAQVAAGPSLLEACGLSDPGEAAWEFSWTQLSEAAECLLAGPEAKRSIRTANDRTFLERELKR